MDLRPPLLACAFLLAGCTQFPELDDKVGPGLRDAEFPSLVPLDPLTAGLGTGREANAATETALEARVDALRARAARLRGTVIDGGTRTRMQRGVDRGAL